MVDRNYIFDRIRSGGMGLMDFDFDSLSAPPLYSLLPPDAIAELHSIAKSVKYSSNLELKYKLIDNIMTKYGFRKFVSGTNRVAYTLLEDSRFIVKVAIDAIGLGDNPAEFKNQFKLRPFVTKVFEVSPCGTVGLFERVKPITNTEEYIAICGDYYNILNTLIRRYVMADIGTHYFMNVGLRFTDKGGWGPVILDFPYVYELDGNKLFCNAPAKGSSIDFSKNPFDQNYDFCGGEIDYDAGYNCLICKKCGKKYKAIELGKSIEENKVIVREREGKHMFKVSVSGGDHAQKKTIVGNPDADKVKSVPNMHVNGVSTVKSEDIHHESAKAEPIIAPMPEEDKLITRTCRVERPTVTETTNVGDTVKVEVKKEEAVEEQKVVKSAKSVIGFVHEEEDPLNLIKKHIAEILSLSGLLSDEETEEVLEDIKGLEVGLDRNSLKKKTEEDYLAEFKKNVDDMDANMDNIEDLYNDALKYDKLVEFINKYYTVRTNFAFDDAEDGDTTVNASSTLIVYTGEETTDNDILYTIDNTGSFNVDYTEPEGRYDEDDDTVEELDEEVEESSDTGMYNGITLVNGIVTNARDVIPSEESNKIIVLSDNDGNYIVDGLKNVIAIDTLDDKSFNKLAIVPSKWLENVQNQLSPDTTVVEEDTEN